MAQWETVGTVKQPAADDGWETIGTQPVTQSAPTRSEFPLSESIPGMEQISQRDPGIDYASGVKNAAFRAGFSFMSNPAEKENFLNQKVGKGNWGVDSYGAYFVNPKGLTALGIKSKTPISIDEQITSRYDVADIAGDMPSILGGVGGSMAATGAGLIPGLVLAGLGAAGGRAYSEIGKQVLGYGRQTSGEVAGGLAGEAASAAAGEGVFRAVRPLGRWFMGPEASRMTPERGQLAQAAQQAGFAPRPGQVTDAPLLSRWEGMTNKLFGDLTQPKNQAAAQTYMDDLLTRLGQAPKSKSVGESVSRSIVAAREKFGKEASKKYEVVDQLVGNKAVVATQRIKDTLNDMVANLPTDNAGNKIFPTPELKQFFDKYGQLADLQTVKQMQQMRTAFREAAYNPDLVPGVEKRQARMLERAARGALNDLKYDPRYANASTALDIADNFYRQGIQQFDNPVVTSIVKDASERGAVDPDMVVDYLIKPGRAERINRVKSIVPPNIWQQVQRSHGEDLIGSIVQKTDDPFLKLFSGQKLERTLDSYGRDTLEAVYGKQWVDDAYKFADIVKLTGKTKAASGGIVAAGIALHPIANLPRLAFTRALVSLIQQPGTFKYLTEGIKAPKTRAGAEALARLTSMATALASDETGSATLTLTAPQKPTGE